MPDDDRRIRLVRRNDTPVDTTPVREPVQSKVVSRVDNPLDPAPGQSKGYALANARKEQRERNLKILEMWKGGMNATQISMSLESVGFEKITSGRIGVIIKRELGKAAEARRHIAEEIFDGELERLTTIIRHAWTILQAQCRQCNGAGVFQNGAVCSTCGGEAKAHPADTRIKAMKEVRAAIDQRAKMLGLYSPDKFALTNSQGEDLNFHPWLDQLSDDELNKALNDFSAGVEAARTLGTSQ